MEKCIKVLHGHSGSQIYLLERNKLRFIRKISNVERNAERLKALYGYVRVPDIYKHEGEVLDMEYIHGLDMKSYLLYHDIDQLIEFLLSTLEKFSSRLDYSERKDYTETYHKKLQWIDDSTDLPFTRDELIFALPKEFYQSTLYHGDLTLENIIYDGREFWLIDPVTIEYDSYIFDIAKLMQDLECKWFLRNDNKVLLDVKLQYIKHKILNKYFEANSASLLILMLLRVYQHCEKNDQNYNFIIKEIHRLWKS